MPEEAEKRAEEKRPSKRKTKTSEKAALKEKEPEEELSIEETFFRLEDILQKMEEGDCSLEESFRYYERGMKLVKSCQEKIDKVEKQIIVLSEEGMEP